MIVDSSMYDVAGLFVLKGCIQVARSVQDANNFDACFIGEKEHEVLGESSDASDANPVQPRISREILPRAQRVLAQAYECRLGGVEKPVGRSRAVLANVRG